MQALFHEGAGRTEAGMEGDVLDEPAVWPPDIVMGEESARFGVGGGAVVVCLLPARTDTQWWHSYVIAHAAEVRFIKGRLKFGGSKNSAPFPSAVVVFRPANGRQMAGKWPANKEKTKWKTK